MAGSPRVPDVASKLHVHNLAVGNIQGNLPLPKSMPGNVWDGGENSVRSDGKPKTVDLQGLPVGATDLKGEYAAASPKISRNGKFQCDPKVDAGCFAEVNAHQELTAIQLKIISLGFNELRGWIGRYHGDPKKFHPVRYTCEILPDMNAYFSSQSDDLTFGTSDGKWFLCGDGDVTVHEFGHYLLHHINKNLIGWSSGDGLAIHEGFGDALAALFHDNPVMSEDFNVAIGNKADPSKGLRDVDNELTMENAGTEEHDLGRVYGAFFWGLKKRIQEAIGGDSRRAADIIMRVLINHASFYTTTRPTSADFVKAVIRGSEALTINGADLGVDSIDALRKIITEEALKRKMIKEEKEVYEAPAQMDFWIKSGGGSTGPAIGVKVFRNEAQIIKSYNKYPKMEIAKTPTQDVTTIGGRMRSYDQFYVLKDGRKARVVGGGLTMSISDTSDYYRVSISDLISFKPGDVDEGVPVREGQAWTFVREKAREEFDEAKSAQETFLMDMLNYYEDMDFSGRKFTLKELEKKFWESLQVPSEIKYQYRRLLLRVRSASVALKKIYERPSLVIKPTRKRGKGYEGELFYEFKMGLSLYYVNTKTGKVRIELDAIM